MRFSNDIIEIPAETKIRLWRFNKGKHSPFVAGDPWDLTAKSVYDDTGAGIYGVWDENITLCGNVTLFQAFAEYNEQVFIELEADRRDIVLVNVSEVTVSRANIVRKLTADEFTQLFPIYRDALYWNKAVYHNDRHGDFNMSKDLAYTRFYHRHTQMQALSIYNSDMPVHGYTHSLRVERNIKLLEKHFKFMGLREFAFYHDIARVSDSGDDGHGRRAVEILKRARQHPNMACMATELFDKLCYACEHHTSMRRSGDPLIDVCFDADRLDLMRTGMEPCPDAMATHIGAHYAENYDVFMSEFLTLE